MNLEEFDIELNELVDAWCERRQLKLLRTILVAYPIVNGLTDEWGELMKALKTIRVQYSPQLENDELDRVIRLLHFAEGMV